MNGKQTPDPDPFDLDPELPFLRELGYSLLADAERIYREHEEATHANAARSRSSRTSTTRRVSRRVATLGGLLTIVAASAWGASTIVGNDGSSGTPDLTTQPHTVASGTLGQDQWSLQIWRSNGALCSELLVAEQEQNGCSPAPAPGQITHLTVDSPTRTYVFGLTAGDVDTVRVSSATTATTTRTHPLSLAAANAAGAPVALHWFMTTLTRHPSQPLGSIKVANAMLRN